jgi:hypothetical protein
MCIWHFARSMKAEKDSGALVVMAVLSIRLTKHLCVFLSNVDDAPRAWSSFLDVVPALYVGRRSLVLPAEAHPAVSY